MRQSRFSILGAATAGLFAVASVGDAAAAPERLAVSPSTPKHRRAGNGPGTKVHQRRAAKRRNVQRNRKAHRG